MKRNALGILLIIIVMSGWLTGCQNKQAASYPVEDLLQMQEQTVTDREDTVVLIHGLWRNASAMRTMEHYLSGKGYRVLNFSYPSTLYPIEVLSAQFLAPVLQQHRLRPDQKIHFVTHSLGGILVRHYLKHNTLPNLGRVVMLGPPNQGTEWADLLNEFEWYQEWTGPTGQQLVTQAEGLTQTLGPVAFELGVIAGNESSNFIVSWVLPGPDDGVIAVANTKVEGMKDFLVVPEKHYNLKRNDRVLQQVAYFLAFGRFVHNEPQVAF